MLVFVLKKWDSYDEVYVICDIYVNEIDALDEKKKLDEKYGENTFSLYNHVITEYKLKGKK